MEYKKGKVSEEEKEKNLIVCKRCKETYTASSNSPTACRFHPSFFVCRRHDDQKRYYELGPDDPHMQLNSMTAAELRMWRHLDAPPVLIFHTTMNNDCNVQL